MLQGPEIKSKAVVITWLLRVELTVAVDYDRLPIQRSLRVV